MKELVDGRRRNTNQIEDVISGTNLYKILRSTTIEGGFKKMVWAGNEDIKSTNNKVNVPRFLTDLPM